MSQRHFSHLHLHTEYSLLDGAISLDSLVAHCKRFDFKSVAMTDHGNIFGAVKFFQKCKKAGIKPILGMEAYYTDDARIKRADDKYNHLILLVQNKQGYKNLCKLISYSYQEGFYFKPRIDQAILERYSEGLIATSTCLGAQIPQLLLNGDIAKAEEKVDWFINLFGPDRFYLEVQPEDQEDQKKVNQKIYELQKRKGLKLVATGDCHYCTPDDHEAHEVMLAIQTHSKMDDPNRYTFGDCRVHIRSTEEMLSIFNEHPDAVWNTGEIADSCDFDFETGKLFFPKFDVPQSYTPETYFEHLSRIGLQRLRENGFIPHELDLVYEERLNLEINLIKNMGFVGYFLIVSDFIQWAYRNDIPVGPGRGSAAGSLVAWALQITNIDPLKYNLLFERFLNPERISMPDIDIDFCIEGRERVIQYVCDRYGHANVCHIITFGTMMAKGVIKDVARALGLPFEDSNMISSYIPDQLKISLKEAIEQEPKLTEFIESNPKIRKIFSIATKLEGLTRHASKHAAGIVISPEPVDEVLPLYVPPKTNELVSQYAMTELEALGFLKIDLLGLKNLTLIARVVSLIEKRHPIKIDINKLPLDDEKTFKLLQNGNTSGVFQLESDGLKEVLRKLRPDKFEDIIAVNALYRPGPLGSGMVDDFIERRHGRQKIVYLFDELSDVLQETYGVIVYQEQVMKIASLIGGYTLGEADILRRAMGKKKAEVMLEQGQLFVDRAEKRGFDRKKAQELFDLMAYFAGYGFNKSHSAAYAMIAYQTAYLKANYPVEFMACLITLEAVNTENMVFYLDEAKNMGIPILPPDINSSMIEFTVRDSGILFGLQGIKNVGLVSLQQIVAEREQKGPFLDLFDFCKRVDLRSTNKRVLENLIAAGSFDTLPGTRTQLFHNIPFVMERAVAYKRDIATGQMGLFGSLQTDTTENMTIALSTDFTEWTQKERLEREKEVMGFYVSAHPLDAYRRIVNRFDCASFDSLLKKVQERTFAEPDPIIIACGRLKSCKEIITKKGDRMAFLHLEDKQGTAEIILFPKTFARSQVWLTTHSVFVVKGVIDIASEKICKIKADQLIPAELVLQEWQQMRDLQLHITEPITPDLITFIETNCLPGTLPLSLIFEENGKSLRLKTQRRVQFDEERMLALEKRGITIHCDL